MKTKIITTITLLVSQMVQAQHARFTTQGVIEFEKKVNTFALISEQIKKYPDDSFGPKVFEDYQRNNPQFKILKSTLNFANNNTLFIPEQDNLVSNNNWFSFPASQQNNTIFTNTSNGTHVQQKKVFEETYLLKDSTRKINWKITSEMREIAGYTCRRANAVILDSIYVVAFYTDKIPVSGGPESFSGLPGMILGVALPREHVTWFATSVKDMPVTDDKIKVPVKGKPTDVKKLTGILKEALKDWGNSANEMLKAMML